MSENCWWCKKNLHTLELVSEHGISYVTFLNQTLASHSTALTPTVPTQSCFSCLSHFNEWFLHPSSCWDPNFEVNLDFSLSCTPNFKSISKSCQLLNLRRVQLVPSFSTTTSMVQAWIAPCLACITPVLVLSRLDYCHAPLIGLSALPLTSAIDSPYSSQRGPVQYQLN